MHLAIRWDNLKKMTFLIISVMFGTFPEFGFGRLTVETAELKHCVRQVGESDRIQVDVTETNDMVKLSFDLSHLSDSVNGDFYELSCLLKVKMLSDTAVTIQPVTSQIVIESKVNSLIGLLYLNYAQNKHVVRKTASIDLEGSQNLYSLSLDNDALPQHSCLDADDEVNARSTLVSKFHRHSWDEKDHSFLVKSLEWTFRKLPCSFEDLSGFDSAIGRWRIIIGNEDLPEGSILNLDVNKGSWFHVGSGDVGLIKSLRYQNAGREWRGFFDSSRFEDGSKVLIDGMLEPGGRYLEGITSHRRYRYLRFRAERQ